jgi:protein SCO1/2
VFAIACSDRSRDRLRSLILATALAIAPRAGVAAPPADPHAAHRHAMQSPVHRSEVDYALPDVQLVRQDGKLQALKDILSDDRIVVVNFIFTTCTTICPLSSQVFAQFQAELGDDRAKVHLVSFSIDPEEDTPARLLEYAKKFHAGSEWDHYTGTLAASLAVQRAFDAYRGDKMSHGPLTLLRAARGTRWVRLDGFASAEDLLMEYHGLAGHHP